MPGGIEEQTELRTPGAIACVPESRYVLTGTAQLLKEGSAPGDGGWVVVASPGRRRGRAPRDWSVDHLLDGRRSGGLCPHLQGLVAGRQEGRPTVGAG